MSRLTSGPASGTDPVQSPAARLKEAAERLQAFGLTPNESRVLAALVSSGSATATELARLAEVHRTGVYPVLEELSARGLVELLPGRSGVWATPGPDDVLRRLWSAHEARLKAVEASLDPTRQLLEDIAGDRDVTADSSIQFLRGAGRIEGAYERLLASARSEVLVFNRPPYGIPSDEPGDVVKPLLARGITVRVVYLASVLDHSGIRKEAENYLRQGLQARAGDDVPIKLAIVDRRAVLFGTGEAVLRARPFPPNVLVDDGAFATAMVPMFEHYWDAARPLRLPIDSVTGPGRHSPRDTVTG
ncbi:MAG: TrmB family transcriptional regulator [Actinomycetota bacterium]